MEPFYEWPEEDLAVRAFLFCIAAHAAILLQIDPARRPRHAIQISRMLNAIEGIKPVRGTFNPADPVHAMRRPTDSNGWRHIQEA